MIYFKISILTSFTSSRAISIKNTLPGYDIWMQLLLHIFDWASNLSLPTLVQCKLLRLEKQFQFWYEKGAAALPRCCRVVVSVVLQYLDDRAENFNENTKKRQKRMICDDSEHFSCIRSYTLGNRRQSKSIYVRSRAGHSWWWWRVNQNSGFKSGEETTGRLISANLCRIDYLFEYRARTLRYIEQCRTLE